jgi:serine protease
MLKPQRTRLPARLTTTLLCAAGLVLGAFATSTHAERTSARLTAPAERTDSARVIVKFRSGSQSILAVGSGQAALQQAKSLGQRIGLTLADGLTIAPRTQVITAVGLSSSALASKLAADSEVEYAVPDRRRHLLAAPNDTLYAGNASMSPASGQWYLHAPTSTVVSSINAETAWNISTGNSSVVVAVLDTGVRTDHPDLTGKLLAGYDFIADVDTANDGDGRDADPSDPGDWVTAAENASGVFQGCGTYDSSWHGTQTAGLIGAATNNGIGMASIGRGVMVLPVRVLGKCGGYDSDIIAGMRWAAGLTVAGVPANPTPAKVISMSLGSAEGCLASYSTAINEIRALGVSVVASAGNDSLATNTPANCTGVIAVGGLRHTGTKNGFASLGSAVTLSAPAGNCVNSTGECLYPILSTSNSGSTGPASAAYTTGGTDAAVGTSFSAPQVSGTIGLMLSVDSALTPDRITTLLKQTARSFPTTGAGTGVSQCTAPGSTEQLECYCTTSTCGAGMLDAGAAVQAVYAALVPTASFSFSANSVTVGNSVTLDASSSGATSGRSISSYAWSISSGSAVSFSSGTSAVTATLLAGSAGSAVITLRVTDSAGVSSSTSQTITVTAAGSGSTSSDSGGGGGALELRWSAALAAAILALAAMRRRTAVKR